MALDRNIGPANRLPQGKLRPAAMRQLREELHAFAAAVVYVTLWELRHRRQGAADGEKPGLRRAHEPGPQRR